MNCSCPDSCLVHRDNCNACNGNGRIKVTRDDGVTLRLACKVCAPPDFERPPVMPTRAQVETMSAIARRDAGDLFPGNRKDYPVLTGALMYFPYAFAELARLSARANEQHNPGEPIHWDYSKSIGDGNETLRHLMDSCGPNPVDAEGVYHDVKVLWRAAETVERRIRRERGIGGPPKPPVAGAGEAVQRVTPCSGCGGTGLRGGSLCGDCNDHVCEPFSPQR